MSDDKPMRVGVIGAGYWGEKLVRVFRALPGVEMRVACDSDAQRRAAIVDIDTENAVDALLRRDDVDAVLVATPPSSHYALARDVLAAGKHCWVEKPLAMRTAEAHELVEAARARRLTLFVDETFLYDPLIQEAKRWIDAERLGRLYHLTFERLGMGRIRRDSDVWWNSAPHDLSILRYLVPRPVEQVRLDGFSYLQPGIADIAVATITLADGVSAHIYVSWLSPVKAASIVVIGSKGMLQYEGRFGQRLLRYFDYELAEPSTVADNVVPIHTFDATETVTGGNEEPLARAAQAFVDSVRSGVPAPSAGEYSLQVVELLEAAAEARSRRG